MVVGTRSSCVRVFLPDGPTIVRSATNSNNCTRSKQNTTFYFALSNFYLSSYFLKLLVVYWKLESNIMYVSE